MTKHSTRVIALFLTLALALTGCEQLLGGDGGGEKKDTGPALKIEDVVAATMALVGTSQLAGVFVNDPAQAFDKSGEEVATAIEAAHAKMTTCYALSRSGATLTLDFKSGCTPPNGSVTVKGKAECTLTTDKAAKKLTVAMKLTDFGAGDKTATGTATMTTTVSDTSADVNFVVNMSAGDAAATGGLNVKMTAAADKKSFEKVQFDTVNPTTISVGEKKGVIVEATGVTYESGSCYPSAGSIVSTYAGIKMTLAFDAGTKSSGVAKFTPPLSKKTEDKQLPGIGWKCK